MIAGLLKAAWTYRFYIGSSIRTDFLARVARSRLGLFWIILSPLAQVAIYALVLSSLMTARLPGLDTPFAYSIYLLAGFAVWFLFIEIVMRSTTVFIDHANALKKIAFPRVVLPVVVAGSAMISNLIYLAIMLVAFALLGHWPGWSIAWLIVLVPLSAALSIGLGLILGVLNTFMRDIGHAVAILIQFGFWLTPILYTPDILPEPIRPLLMLNPLYWLLGAYRDVLVFDRTPDLLALAGLAVLAVALLALALTLFRRSSGEMVDVL
jgi:lipopolysaccharide transport system permease protein